MAVGFAIGAGIDLAAQLYSNGGDLSKVNVTQVLVSGAVGAIGVGVGSLIAKTALTVGKQIVANAIVSGGVSAAGAAVQNELQDPNLPKANVLSAAVIGAGTGGVGAMVGEGAKTAVKAFANAKYARLTAAQRAMVDSNAIIRPPNVKSIYHTFIGIGNALGIIGANSGPVVTASPPQKTED